MNRNVESHFAMNPSVNIKRSKFDRSFGLKTTGNAGELIPIFLDEVLPGDTFQVDTSFVARMATPIFPVMDNCFLDYYFFFVPNRLVWDHWEEFCGDNKEGYWTQPTEYTIPTIQYPLSTLDDEDRKKWSTGSLADYFGLPTNLTLYAGRSSNGEFNALPLRGYCRIWNEWFRDENLMNPAYYPTGDAMTLGEDMNPELTGTDAGNQTAYKGGCLLCASKYHDYFTSALPDPQKGPAVRIPFTSAEIPVTTGVPHGLTTNNPLLFNNKVSGFSYGRLITSNWSGNTAEGTNYSQVQMEPISQLDNPSSNQVNGQYYQPVNLYANAQDFTATIESLRQAFATQHIYEIDARGSRYIELINNHFGVRSPDQRLQRTEYLGGARIPININQVLQTSATEDVGTPQGNTAAYSMTSDTNRSNFTHSFTEHGHIIGLAVIRTEHSYQQGVNKMWFRRRRFDYYWPALADLGEQPILNREIYCQMGDAQEQDTEVFGYQEAWAEYRYKPNMVTGYMKSTAPEPLDSWHYADYYTSLPILSGDWMIQGKNEVDRTLAVQSDLSHQFLFDFYFKLYTTRPMPVRSIPAFFGRM